MEQNFTFSSLRKEKKEERNVQADCTKAISYQKVFHVNEFYNNHFKFIKNGNEESECLMKRKTLFVLTNWLSGCVLFLLFLQRKFLCKYEI